MNGVELPGEKEVDTQPLWDVLAALGLDDASVIEYRLDKGLPVTLDDGELLAHAFRMVVEQLEHEVQKRGVLSDAYAALRREHITALMRLHRAHQAVARAAVTYQDPKLAALARDELRGLPKAQAEQQIPRTAEVLKKAGL
ncbi:hypothetical protein SAMN04488058_101329 [Deinococcus reticulitermitis]|uniref:Uncharacterized protein n=1 Tax=Deinococcus reticulitermitis TaxID=856736 RepID=A0A1H6SK66_9DEIO|nr:hypothetical protein [Deinococcus reticulitermitis]SEI68201.1 hypothetical protein SAMN04488058_101329 [Deinococcus reticulitermitis]